MSRFSRLFRALRLSLLLVPLVFVTAFSPAKCGVLLQGFYWDVPSPAAGTATAPWWWDHLGQQANMLSTSGFSAVWIPPQIKGASGGYSDGYDPFDDYDLGSKNEMSTIPTRYGTREQLERCCAVLRANGLDIYADIVDNHRNGDPGNYSFQYLDAYGNASSGRFQKGYYDFHPNVAQDPYVPLGTSENFSEFGRDLAPINGAGSWIYNGLNSAGDWQTKALDLQGYRLDDVKGISTQWLYNFLNYGAMSGKFAVGEFYDTNLSNVENWVKDNSQSYPPGMQGRSNAFDFPLRDLLKQMCNSPSTFNMSSLDHAGLAGLDPSHAVTFVENHDTDRSDPITTNKALAYADILTSEGYPCVFYKDYSTDSGCYGMKSTIDNLIWIHEKIASGTTQQRWKNGQIFCYERMGGGHLLVGLNSDTASAHTITCATGFGSGVQLHDYTGHESDVWTDGSGNVTITIPVNNNGLSYVCYSKTGYGGGFTPPRHSTTQEYAGAQDLDIKPADNTTKVQVCRVYAAGGASISGALYYDTSSWTSSTNIYLELDNSSGSAIASRYYYSGTAQGTATAATAASTGWYTWKITSHSTPSGNARPNYWLRSTYTAPLTF